MVVQTPIVTDAHRQQYQTFGFVVFRQLFTPEEVERYGAALERAMRRRRGGADFDGQKTQTINPSLMDEDPAVFYPLFDDDRLNAIVDGLLGENSGFTLGNDGSLYVGDTRWHSDSGAVHSFGTMKTAFYCDPVFEGQGCLSVIAGSHHPEFSAQIYQAIKAGIVDIHSADVPGRVPLESMPGDLVVFDHRLWHASFGGGRHRRMFTFNWFPEPTLGWQEMWIRGFVWKCGYSHHLIETAGPRRRRRLAKLLEMVERGVLDHQPVDTVLEAS